MEKSSLVGEQFRAKIILEKLNSKNIFLRFIFERERGKGAGAERDRDTESEAGSRLGAVSTEPDMGLELVRS